MRRRIATDARSSVPTSSFIVEMWDGPAVAMTKGPGSDAESEEGEFEESE